MVMMLLATGVMLAGCSSGARYARENERLRKVVAELEDEVDRLDDVNRQLTTRLTEAQARPEEISEAVARNTPQVAKITIGWLSHSRDDDGDGRPETLVIHVTPSDGRNRFVQMVGSLDIHAALLPPGADAVTIGRVAIGPDEISEVYRSGLLGPHYAIEIPIALDDGVNIEDCSVRAVFSDGRTGIEHAAQRSVDL